MCDCDLKNAIPIDKCPTRPRNIASVSIILPQEDKSAVISIESPTVPSAEAASKHSSKKENFSLTVRR